MDKAKVQEMKAKGILSLAGNLTSLVTLGAPQAVIDNQFKLLQERIEKFHEDEGLSADDIQKSINYRDHLIIKHVVSNYHFDEIKRTKKELEERKDDSN